MRLRARSAAAILAGMAVGFVGCGDDDEGGGGEAPGPAAPAAAVTAAPDTPGVAPFPTKDHVALENGTTYTTTSFRPTLRITLQPGEWMAGTGDRPDHLTVEREVDRGDAFVGFHHFTKVFDPRKGGVKPGDMVAGPRDVVRWLRTHPHLRTTAPVPVTRLGLRGVRIDMGVRSSPPRVPRDCAKVTSGGGDCVALFHDGFDFAVYPEAGRSRFYVLGQPGEQLVVELSAMPKARFASRVKMLERQLDGVTIEPG